MLQPRRVVVLLALIASVVLVPASAHAQFLLKACNRGTVPVQVVVAHAQGTFAYSWAVAGRTIQPGWCYEYSGWSLEALIAFAARDSRGRFVSLTPTTLPDMGDRSTTIAEMAKSGRIRTPVLSRDNRTICVAPTDASYSTEDTRVPAPAECPQLTLPDVGRLAAITTSYFVSAPEGVIGTYHVSVRANPDRGVVTMTPADYEDHDVADAGSAPYTTNATTTAYLLGRRVSVGADSRWHFDDGSVAFENLGSRAPDSFFDISVRPPESVTIAPADLERGGALIEAIGALLKPTGVRINFTIMGDWGEHRRLCFEDAGMIRCANFSGLDFDNTSVNDHSVSFNCRGGAICAFMAAPWNASRGLGKVRLKDSDRQLTAQAVLFVNGLPSLQAARSLASMVREIGVMRAKFEERVR